MPEKETRGNTRSEHVSNHQLQRETKRLEELEARKVVRTVK